MIIINRHSQIWFIWFILCFQMCISLEWFSSNCFKLFSIRISLARFRIRKYDMDITDFVKKTYPTSQGFIILEKWECHLKFSLKTWGLRPNFSCLGLGRSNIGITSSSVYGKRMTPQLVDMSCIVQWKILTSHRSPSDYAKWCNGTLKVA